DGAGARVGTLAAAEAVREPLDAVPAVFADSLVRWEDARFRAHDGVDRVRIVGAAAALLNGDPQGGSTLTMQLAKLVKRDSARTAGVTAALTAVPSPRRAGSPSRSGAAPRRRPLPAGLRPAHPAGGARRERGGAAARGAQGG